MIPMPNANKNIYSGENLSRKVQRIYPPGSATIPIAVWNIPNAVHFCCPSDKSTTKALSVPSTIAKTIPKMMKKSTTPPICVTKDNHKVTNKNNPYPIQRRVFLHRRSESIPTGVENRVYTP